MKRILIALLCGSCAVYAPMAAADTAKKTAATTTTHSTTHATPSAGTKTGSVAKSTAAPKPGAKTVSKTTAKATTSKTKSASSGKGSSSAVAKSTSTTVHGTGKRGKKVAAARRPSYQTAPTPERYQQIQQSLADRGFYKGEVNGVWGADSLDAMKHFQASQNLPDDGKISSKTLIGLGLGSTHATQPGATLPAANQPGITQPGTTTNAPAPATGGPPPAVPTANPPQPPQRR